MPVNSRHLKEIVERHNRTCNALVAFVDVESYSKRRTLNQIEVIDAMTSDLQAAIDSVAKKYLTYCQNNDLNFKSDVIKIPTGDGAAVVLSLSSRSFEAKTAIGHCFRPSQDISQAGCCA